MSPVTIAEGAFASYPQPSHAPVSPPQVTRPNEPPVTEVDKMLEDLLAAESWESMAMRSVARAEPTHRNLVPVLVVARRRAA